ncbi:MAG: class I SAM-dependent methyltransferase [Pseudomonadales bacterium]|nr:class I SAM-dependent methyltransferase [Pseudomonadales bacterium]
MWDERYAVEEYVYGTEPNSFLAEYAGELSGPVLSIAEGEGRNAVFLAAQGLTVVGVDSSTVGLKKAQALARDRDVSITTQVADLNDYIPEADFYGAVVSIFAHLPAHARQKLYPRLVRSLKAGGLLLLEAYTEGQFAYGTGGPKDIDMLMSSAKIKAEFPGLEPILLRELERDVTEGSYHSGRAAVVQFIGRKV